ncbi:MAG TPA: hypothetical protein VFE18_13400 [Phenylobacterium sp.]|jgi:hypothetical protein|uniref:hypothetical protein n=1 Tax=Phenylobacterium sp. TaxID=1871053 RepID=UPI002D243D05|nr:hypothetical protein [Phenylobacterium sp.]HZZ69162.1 hypothetical protein [Phenylobacterium sp.]
MADTSQSDQAAQPVLKATPARQGRYGRHVFWVLVVSTLLAAIGLFFAWTWKSPSLNAADSRVNATKAQAAQQFNTAGTMPPATVTPPAH